MSVLHDTLMAFIGKVDRTLVLHERRQDAQERNIQMIVRRGGLKSDVHDDRMSAASTLQLNANGSGLPKDRRDQEHEAEGMSYPIMDEEGKSPFANYRLLAVKYSLQSNFLEKFDLRKYGF